jgi:hypothetical protein
MSRGHQAGAGGFCRADPRMLFEHTWRLGLAPGITTYRRDGRFLMLLETGEGPPHQRLSKWCWCYNWFEELKR